MLLATLKEQIPAWTKFAKEFDPENQQNLGEVFFDLDWGLRFHAAETAKLPALLDEVKTSLSGTPLDAKHIRIASATVHAINRIKDDEQATKRMKEFGELFATSGDVSGASMYSR
jgi:hypothetical protein